MNTLRKAMALFLDNPRLWLPVIVAGLLDIGISFLSKGYWEWLAARVFFASRNGSPLLIHSTQDFAFQMWREMFLANGIGMILEFPSFLFFVVSLYVTAQLVRPLLSGKGLAVALSPWPVKEILRLTGWIFGISWSVMALGLLLRYFQLELPGSTWLLWFQGVGGFCLFMAGAWLCASFMVRFVAVTCDGAAGPAAISTGRKLVCLIAGVCYLFSIAVRLAVEGVFYLATDVPVDDSLAQAFAHLTVLAAPVIVLFIALALLTKDESGEPLHEAI